MLHSHAVLISCSEATRHEEKVWVSVTLVLTHGGQREMSGSYWITPAAQAGRAWAPPTAQRGLCAMCHRQETASLFQIKPVSSLRSHLSVTRRPFDLHCENGTDPAGIKMHPQAHTKPNEHRFFPRSKWYLNLIQKQYGHCSGMHG